MLTKSFGVAAEGTSSYKLQFLEGNRIVELWNNEFKDIPHSINLRYKL